jgi:hypothetical protein
MTSGRPYRGNELSLTQALDELRRNAGTQFDPRVVLAVEAAIASGDFHLLPRTNGQFPAVTTGVRIGLVDSSSRDSSSIAQIRD